MPLRAMTMSSLVHRCSKCDRVREIEFDELTVELGDDPLVACAVRLPWCPGCRTEEHLLGASAAVPEHPHPGSYAHLHRLLVDHACAELIRAGRGSNAAAVDEARVRRRPPGQLAAWFPSGLSMPPDPVPVAEVRAE
jgi:hypothetical protein